MAHLSVRNFGPIQELELDIQDFMVLIGPSGSGKSTVAKLVHYFQQLPGEFSERIAEICALKSDDISKIDIFQNIWNTQFKPLFNRAFHSASLVNTNWFRHDSLIKFTYPTGTWIQIQNDQGKMVGIFSEGFVTGTEIKEWVSTLAPKFEYMNSLPWIATERKLLFSQIAKEITNFEQLVFGQSSNLSPVFTAAERIIGPYLSQQDVQNLLRNSFAEDVYLVNEPPIAKTSRNPFGPFIAEMARRRINLIHIGLNSRTFQDLGKQNIDPIYISHFLKKVFEVLGGQWEYSGGEEWLVFPNGNRISLRAASSGQQVSTGLFLELFNSMLEGGENRNLSRAQETATSFFIEEPEAHLFPIQQKAILEAVAIVFNAILGNQVFITTHSPYVLTALDNLVQAHEIAQTSPENRAKVAAVIPETMWIPFDQLGAYLVQDGVLTDIRNYDRRGIGGNALDTASDTIEQTFDSLLAIKYGETA